MKKKKILSAISFLTAIVMLTSLSGCAKSNLKVESSADNMSTSSDSFDVNDAFVELNINGINVNEIEVTDIQIDDIDVDPIIIESIDVLETEVVSITDNMVMLAHQNFVSYYGDCFDLNEFLKDVAIGSMVVCGRR